MTSKYLTKALELQEQHPEWGTRKLAETLGIDRRGLQRVLGHHNRTAVAERANSPPIEPVPPGFHLSSVATTIDAFGKTRSQSFRAKSGEEGDVVPESGTFPAPEGMFVRSTSTLVDGQTGTVKQQWVKADVIAQEKFKAMQLASLRAAVAELPPLPIIPEPNSTVSELCNVYTLTDCHVGMLAWGREAGEPWDLKIAEDVLVDAFSRLVLASPPAESAVVNELGDFEHFDSLRPVTPEHGHILDADSRFQKMVEIAVKIIRRVVEIALMRHKIVYLKLMEGNHDEASSAWKRVLFTALYENNPRVVVDASPLPYAIHKHGHVLLGFHHGHCTAKINLPAIFSARWRKEWGESLYTYIHTGHLHNQEVKEYPGCKVEQHPTLAAADAYAARSGFMSRREATAITYHCEFGEYCRHTVVPKEV